MAEYIEREVLLAELYSKQDAKADIALLIAEFPAADVAPVRHGRWVFENDYQSRCTSCKKTSWVDHGDAPHYCPRCGARMDKEAEHGTTD